jgi:hypothetical protein
MENILENIQENAVHQKLVIEYFLVFFQTTYVFHTKFICAQPPAYMNFGVSINRKT